MRNKVFIRIFAIIALLAFVVVSILAVLPSGAGAITVEEAQKVGAKYHVGNVLSSDSFYDFDENDKHKWARMGVLAIEMESAALYMNAALTGKKALGIFTVSDQLIKQQYLTASERETLFTQMMEVALNTATRL